MCGRFTSMISSELLSITFGVQVPDTSRPRYNIAPTQNIPVVREINDGGRYLSTVRWGQTPSWANDLAIGTSQINTTAEMLTIQASSGCQSNHCRCIIPANGFYIWQHEGFCRQPWYVKRKDSAYMAFAGLLKRWKTPGGNEIDTCTIITIIANDLIRQIHDRMPATIAIDDLSLWLSCSQISSEVYRSILKSEPSETLDIYTVGPQVNRPACDTDDCIRMLRQH